MSLYYPKKDDYSTDALSNDIIMDKDKFTQNFNHMFPEGRVFLNMKQLRIAVKEFFQHWNLLSKSNGKSIRCSYSFTPGTKKQQKVVK